MNGFQRRVPPRSQGTLNLFEEMNVGEALDPKTRALILVAINSTTRAPLSTRFWVRQVFKAGASKEEIESASLLAWCQGVSSAEMSIPIIVEEAEKR